MQAAFDRLAERRIRKERIVLSDVMDILVPHVPRNLMPALKDAADDPSDPNETDEEFDTRMKKRRCETPEQESARYIEEGKRCTERVSKITGLKNTHGTDGDIILGLLCRHAENYY